MNPTAPNAKRFKLYYWSSQDFYRQIQTMGKLDLGLEIFLDSQTAIALGDSWSKKEKQ